MFKGKVSEELSEAQLKYAVPWVILRRRQDVVLERKYTEEKKLLQFGVSMSEFGAICVR